MDDRQLQDAARQTPSYRQFLSSGKKHLYEKDFINLRKNVVAEAWGKIPEDVQTFNGAMAWSYPKNQAIREALKEDGVTVHMNTDYEEAFAEWCKRQGPAPATFPSNLDWYSQKRKEFDRIYRDLHNMRRLV